MSTAPRSNIVVVARSRATTRAGRAIRPARRGVGLVELMIALAIIAALMTAVGTATDAAFQGYAINQEQSALTQNARVALHRLLLQVRTSEAHAANPVAGSPENQQLKAGQTVYNSPGIALFDNSGTMFHYHWNAAAQRVYVDVHRADGSQPTTHALLHGVTDFRATLEPIPGTRGKLKRATIQFTLEAAGADDAAGDGGAKQRVTFSSSAVPRRNVW